MGLAVGDEAPDFTLDGIDGWTGEQGIYRLAEQRGEVVVLAFYPADNSPVCSRQMKAYTRDFARFDELGATVWAVSPQDAESHRHFADAHGGFAFPLLSDHDKDVGRAYGILGLLDLYRRSVFVLDRDGRIAYLHRFIGPGLGFTPVDDLVAAVERIGR